MFAFWANILQAIIPGCPSQGPRDQSAAVMANGSLLRVNENFSCRIDCDHLAPSRHCDVVISFAKFKSCRRKLSHHVRGRRQLSRGRHIPHSATRSRSGRPLKPRRLPTVRSQSTQACFPRYLGSAHGEIRTSRRKTFSSTREMRNGAMSKCLLRRLDTLAGQV